MRIAIIPARGGSRGIPLKNLSIVGGQSLIARCVKTCIAAGLETCVTTDHGGIADAANSAGAYVVMRPPELATDHAKAPDAIRHAIRKYPDATEVVVSQCTSPMTTAADLHGCLNGLPEYDIVLCCVPFHGILLDASGKPANQPAGFNLNRQERQPQYQISGNCYAFRPSYLEQPWLSGRVGIHVATYPHMLDIDRPEDLELAKRIVETPVYYPI